MGYLQKAAELQKIYSNTNSPEVKKVQRTEI